jgi:hypothetical protein
MRGAAPLASRASGPSARAARGFRRAVVPRRGAARAVARAAARRRPRGEPSERRDGRGGNGRATDLKSASVLVRRGASRARSRTRRRRPRATFAPPGGDIGFGFDATRRDATRRSRAPFTPPSPLSRSRAAQGIEEDHAHEQFFYDDATTERLVRFAKQYERPLFLCTPSLAAAAARMTAASSSGSGSSRGGDRGGGFSDYLLLDRDARWEKKLPKGKFRRFDLASPRRIGTRFSYDAVFCDPPFANVALRDLRRTIDLLATDDAQRAAPLWLCFVADREADVMDAFEGYELERKPPALGYRSVRRKTQERIFLYGPRAGGTRAKAPSATEAGGSAGDGSGR